MEAQPWINATPQKITLTGEPLKDRGEVQGNGMATMADGRNFPIFLKIPDADDKALSEAGTITQLRQAWETLYPGDPLPVPYCRRFNHSGEANVVVVSEIKPEGNALKFPSIIAADGSMKNLQHPVVIQELLSASRKTLRGQLDDIVTIDEKMKVVRTCVVEYFKLARTCISAGIGLVDRKPGDLFYQEEAEPHFMVIDWDVVKPLSESGTEAKLLRNTASIFIEVLPRTSDFDSIRLFLKTVEGAMDTKIVTERKAGQVIVSETSPKKYSTGVLSKEIELLVRRFANGEKMETIESSLRELYETKTKKTILAETPFNINEIGGWNFLKPLVDSGVVSSDERFVINSFISGVINGNFTESFESMLSEVPIKSGFVVSLQTAVQDVMTPFLEQIEEVQQLEGYNSYDYQTLGCLANDIIILIVRPDLATRANVIRLKENLAKIKLEFVDAPKTQSLLSLADLISFD